MVSGKAGRCWRYGTRISLTYSITHHLPTLPHHLLSLPSIQFYFSFSPSTPSPEAKLRVMEMVKNCPVSMALHSLAEITGLFWSKLLTTAAEWEAMGRDAMSDGYLLFLHIHNNARSFFTQCQWQEGMKRWGEKQGYQMTRSVVAILSRGQIRAVFFAEIY